MNLTHINLYAFEGEGVFDPTSADNGQTYDFVVTLVDQAGNESGYSSEVAVTPGP